jgi:catalase
MLVHANNAPYSPNTVNGGFPKQANRNEGKGFFTSPNRKADGRIQRSRAKSLQRDYYSQPRLFFNSLLEEEQQFLVNAIRFETSHLKSPQVKANVITELNKIHHKIARDVAETLGMPAPQPDRKYYHENRTSQVSMFDKPLNRLAGLKIGILATTRGLDTQLIGRFQDRFGRQGVKVVVVAEQLGMGVDQTYSATDATDFDAIVVANGVTPLFQSAIYTTSYQFPAGRPRQIVLDAYRFGKPIAFAGDSSYGVMAELEVPNGPGVYSERLAGGPPRGPGGPFSNTTILGKRAEENSEDDNQGRQIEHRIEEGLKRFKFLNRFKIDQSFGRPYSMQRNQTDTGAVESDLPVNSSTSRKNVTVPLYKAAENVS